MGTQIATVWNAKVGDDIICGGEYAEVVAVTLHEPGHHVGAIRTDWYAVVVTTTRGTRVCGHNPELVGSLIRGAEL